MYFCSGLSLTLHLYSPINLKQSSWTPWILYLKIVIEWEGTMYNYSIPCSHRRTEQVEYQRVKYASFPVVTLSIILLRLPPDKAFLVQLHIMIDLMVERLERNFTQKLDGEEVGVTILVTTSKECIANAGTGQGTESTHVGRPYHTTSWGVPSEGHRHSHECHRGTVTGRSSPESASGHKSREIIDWVERHRSEFRFLCLGNKIRVTRACFYRSKDERRNGVWEHGRTLRVWVVKIHRFRTDKKFRVRTISILITEGVYFTHTVAREKNFFIFHVEKNKK